MLTIFLTLQCAIFLVSNDRLHKNLSFEYVLQSAISLPKLTIFYSFIAKLTINSLQSLHNYLFYSKHNQFHNTEQLSLKYYFCLQYLNIISNFLCITNTFIISFHIEIFYKYTIPFIWLANYLFKFNVFSIEYYYRVSKLIKIAKLFHNTLLISSSIQMGLWLILTLF